jgi:hypothetical protein
VRRLKSQVSARAELEPHRVGVMGFPKEFERGEVIDIDACRVRLP